MALQQPQEASGPPYAPADAILGGTPNTNLDAPITSAFLVLFIVGAGANMTIFQLNRRRGHKFLASAAFFGFCMTRVVASTMRLVWSVHQASIPISIAARIFVSAGVVIIIIINLIFAQRILRASHPTLGWHRITNYLFLLYYLSIILSMMALITSIILQSYTLGSSTHRMDRDIQLVGATYQSFAAIGPLPIIVLGLAGLKMGHGSVENFGTGRFDTKLYVIFTSTLLITVGAAFRAGIEYVPRPADDPALYHSRACFYCVDFLPEVLVIYLYLVMRVDRRFHVPNGANGPGDYSTNHFIVETRSVGEREILDDFKPVYGEKVENIGAAENGSAL